MAVDECGEAYAGREFLRGLPVQTVSPKAVALGSTLSAEGLEMFVKNVNVLLSEWIKVPVDGLPPMLERKLHERLTFTNPDYEMRHNRGEWIGNVPAQISCFKQKGRNYLIPRGFLDQFIELCKRYQIPYRMIDKRRLFDPISMEFHGELKSYQQDAAEAVLDTIALP